MKRKPFFLILLKPNRVKFSFLKSFILNFQIYREYLKKTKILDIYIEYKTHYQIAFSYKKIIKFYDIIQAYSVDPIYFSFFNQKTPYIAYEHGTLRQFPFLINLMGILTKKAYKKARFCFITNADNIKSAKKLNLKNYCFIPHPINEKHIQDANQISEFKKKLHIKFSCNEIIFHPARHDWGEKSNKNMRKANDIFFRGFSKYLHNINPNAFCLTTEWGDSVDTTKALLKELKIKDRVEWIKPLPNIDFIKYLKSSEIVADQFYLGAFGSLTPKALMVGIPVLLYLNRDLHKWAFNRMPPVLNVNNEIAVYDALKQMHLDLDRKEKLSRNSKKWYSIYHSNEVIFKKFCQVYSKIIN